MPKLSGAVRIAVYHPHSDSSTVPSGAEYVVMILARELLAAGQVDLIHHKPHLNYQSIRENYGLDLADVRLRYIPSPRAVPVNTPLRRFLAEYRSAGFTSHYDLFIASAHDIPPFCRARRGALYVHFPRFSKVDTWPWIVDGKGMWSRFRRLYANCEWHRRFAGYQVAMVNSAFTGQFLREWWGLEPTVVFAPAGVRPLVDREKRNRIISVGRFTTDGTSKNQLEMMRVFCDLRREVGSDWEYVCVGGLGVEPAHKTYFADVAALGSQCGAVVRANVPRSELEGMISESRVFWHAAGLTASTSDPRLLEHFGIVTVEAMSAGCVPVVLARGGQVEIVEHGINGFLWNNLDELEAYTLRLLRDPDLTARMSLAARARAEKFSVEAFGRRVKAALLPLLAHEREAH